MGLFDPIKKIGKSIESGTKGYFQGREDFLDKNFNFNLFPEPKIPSIKKPIDRQLQGDLIRALQQRILRSSRQVKGRAGTVATSTRGVQ